MSADLNSGARVSGKRGCGARIGGRAPQTARLVPFAFRRSRLPAGAHTGKSQRLMYVCIPCEQTTRTPTQAVSSQGVISTFALMQPVGLR